MRFTTMLFPRFQNIILNYCNFTGDNEEDDDNEAVILRPAFNQTKNYKSSEPVRRSKVRLG